MRLSVGDFLAKALYFLALVYLARVLGVERFGVLEFALSLLTWFLLMADGGLELWATREAAQTGDVRALAARVLPLRFLLATLAFAVLVAILPLLPRPTAFPNLLRLLMALYGLSLFANAVSLKWAFLGQEQMGRVGAGLVVAQIVFALAIFGFVRQPEDIIWVPLMRFASDVALAIYFARLFVRAHGSLLLPYRLRGAAAMLAPALTMGASQAMGLLNYNFDMVLLGFLRGMRDTGLYGAAYRPVTVALAMPLTYFIGLFPALARASAEGPAALRALVSRSFRLCAIIAVPLGVGGTMLAAPVIAFLFGPPYAESALVLQILIWSAVFVILRGSYRHSLVAAGHQRLDLRCALISAGLNVGLNIALIPRYGMVGAASATLFADMVWFAMSVALFQQAVMRLNPVAFLARPLVAGAVMGASLWLAEPVFWMARAALATAVYFAALLAMGEPEVRAWARTIASQDPNT